MSREKSKLFDLIYGGMGVGLLFVIESDTMVNRIGLGLSFKTECTVEYLLHATLKIRAVAQEITNIELLNIHLFKHL